MSADAQRRVAEKKSSRRKQQRDQREQQQQEQQQAAVPRAAYTIPEFCEAHRFSRATYYNLPPDERPDEARVLGRKLITMEAAAAWRTKRTVAASEQATAAK